MIEYKPLQDGDLGVYLDGKYTGRIVDVAGGYQYWPMGQKDMLVKPFLQYSM